eukprot:1764467-Amphidinium_carterae.1
MQSVYGGSPGRLGQLRCWPRTHLNATPQPMRQVNVRCGTDFPDSPYAGQGTNYARKANY